VGDAVDTHEVFFVVVGTVTDSRTVRLLYLQCDEWPVCREIIKDSEADVLDAGDFVKNYSFHWNREVRFFYLLEQWKQRIILVDDVGMIPLLIEVPSDPFEI